MSLTLYLGILLFVRNKILAKLIWEKSTLRQIPAPPDHFVQVEDFLSMRKKEHSANVTGILANTNFELTFAPRRASSFHIGRAPSPKNSLQDSEAKERSAL
jgi:hypothetical protein